MRNVRIEFDKKGSTSKVNLDVDQFADNFFGFRIVGSADTSINLSGYGFTGTIKKHVGASSTAIDTISVGIITDARSSGILTVRVTSGVTTTFDKNNSRYTYEVIATSDSDGYKRKLVSGDVNVNVGITNNDSAIGTNIKCIAVIDESNNGDVVSVNSYNSFRNSFPGREHFLLQPTTTGIANTSELISSSLQSVYISGFGSSKQVQGVNRDDGVEADRSDWFAVVGLQTGVDTEVALFVDISGSMTLSTVQESYDFFFERTAAAGIGVRTETNAAEDWIEPFTGLLLES